MQTVRADPPSKDVCLKCEKKESKAAAAIKAVAADPVDPVREATLDAAIYIGNVGYKLVRVVAGAAAASISRPARPASPVPLCKPVSREPVYVEDAVKTVHIKGCPFLIDAEAKLLRRGPSTSAHWCTNCMSTTSV